MHLEKREVEDLVLDFYFFFTKDLYQHGNLHYCFIDEKDIFIEIY